MSKSNFSWAPDQQAIFDWVEKGSGSAIVEAVAGAGKTTTIVEAARRMSAASDRETILLCAYNTKIATELKGRVAGIRGVEAGTFHSAGFKALRRAAAGRLSVDANKVRNLARAAVKGTVHENTDGLVPAIGHLVSMAKQIGLYCDDCVPRPSQRDWLDLVERYEIDDRLPEDFDVRDLVTFAQAVLRASNDDRLVIDFDDMIYLPLQRRLQLFRHHWLLVDECQDLTPTRRALAAKMLRREGRLVAVGDPHQAIYGFSGADSDSMENTRRQFRATVLRLSVTWRCPRVVVAAAHEYVRHIRSADTAPDGLHSDMSFAEMLKFSAAGDAILCRFNAPLVDLAFRLIREGKPARIEGRAIGEGLAALAGRWKVRSLDVLEKRLEKYQEREVAKAVEKDDEGRAERITDQVATMNVLINRGREQGITTVSGLQEMIRSMFDDVGNNSKLIVLSSVHRSKGLEWDRVFILGRRELMPSKRARQDWALAQEQNLCYVAVTRARQHLIDVALEVAGETMAADKKDVALAQEASA